MLGVKAPSPKSINPNNMTVLPIASSSKLLAVTPSDTAALQFDGKVLRTKGVYIGGEGDLAVDAEDGTAGIFQNVPAGSILPIDASFINATNTTATSIVALF